MNEHPIEGLMDVTLEKIKSMVDSNTIIGNPINMPDGTLILPVSKVSFGFATGGSDFPSKTSKQLFGGGGFVTVVICRIDVADQRLHGVRIAEVLRFRLIHGKSNQHAAPLLPGLHIFLILCVSPGGKAAYCQYDCRKEGKNFCAEFHLCLTFSVRACPSAPVAVFR